MSSPGELTQFENIFLLVPRPPDSPPALQMHGDAFRVRQDVFLDGNGDVGERMVSQQMIGDVGAVYSHRRS
jgi:hypothetical protein